MNSKTKIAFIAGTLLVMILLVWLISGNDEPANPTSSKREPFISDNWSRMFQPQEKDPYGLYLFDILTAEHIDKGRMIYIDDAIKFDTLIDFQKGQKTYFFVGNSLGLNDDEIDTLVQRVADGSDMFFSFWDMTENVVERLMQGVHSTYEYNDHVNVFTDSARYQMIYLYQNDTISTEWRLFALDDTLNCTTLSSFMEMTNFVRIPVGEGNIYLHANPEMFFNYQIKRKDGFAYTQFVLSHIRKNQDVYALEIGRLSDNYGNYNIDEQSGADGKVDDSYFQDIFSNKSLLSALLLSIFALLLFVLFRSRRMRPVVPYLAPKKNMTMAFAETITSIYFSKRNPYGLLQVQRRNFYTMVHKHFFVDLQRREDDKPIQALAEKSNRRIEEIKELLGYLESKEAFSVTDQFVADVQKRLHAFYRSTGIITDEIRERVKNRDAVYKRSMLLPVILILAGVFFIVFGTYYLIVSIGAGIAFWPLGILCLYQGIIRLTNPYLKVTKHDIIYYKLPFGKQLLKRAELRSVEKTERGVIFHFNDSQQLIINYREMSSFDRKQFKQWISQLNTLKL